MLRSILCALLGLSLSSLSGAQCGDKSPAYPTPETLFTGSGFTRLWPTTFRPARPGERIPASRDSTDRIAGTTIPGAASGHELFKFVGAADSRYLFVAYNAGLQVWDLANPALPSRVAARDGWLGDFLSFPPVSEQLTFVEDLSVVLMSDGRYLVALSGKHPVGSSLWLFDAAGGGLEVIFQDATNSREVSLEKVGGRTVLVTGSDTAGVGLGVYDAIAALTRFDLTGQGCLESTASGNRCGARLGEIPSTHAIRYLDTTVEGGDLYVATSGLFWPLELWKVGNVDQPGAAQNVLPVGDVGFTGVALFRAGGVLYLAATRDSLKIWDISSCVASPNCQAVLEASEVLYRGSATDGPLLASENGRTWLYAGVEHDGNEGAQVEYLFEVSGLGGGSVTLEEITASGETYFDPCTNQTAGYWSYQYPSNSEGLREFRPRAGIFVGEFFYRAAQSVLDVHVRHAGSPPDAAMVFFPTRPIAGETVRFEDASTGATSRTWTFEDGTPSSAVSRDPVVTFEGAGFKVVRLEACNSSGCDVATESIEIRGQAPEILSISVREVSP